MNPIPKSELGFATMNEPSQAIHRNFPIWNQQQPRPRPAMLHPSSDSPIPFHPTRIPNPNRMNWSRSKAGKKRKLSSTAGEPSGYQLPSMNDLQFQNRVIARRLYPKKNINRFAPYAPRNTTSFIIRSKKSGGIASLPSVSPATPAILPTPKFSPSREGLVDMAKEEWGVDGYGSMKGLIRLRSGQKMEGEEIDEDGSSDSEVEEHLEVDRRMDHDLSRFEMVHPSFAEDQGAAATYVLENRVDDQEARIAKLEEENLTLKERMFLMEREMREMSERLDRLENISNNNGNGDNDNDVGGVDIDDNEQEHSYNSNVHLNGDALWDNGGVCLEEKSGDCDGDEKGDNLMGVEGRMSTTCNNASQCQESTEEDVAPPPTNKQYSIIVEMDGAKGRDAKKWSSRCGVLSRALILVSYDDWRKVDSFYKDNLWKHLRYFTSVIYSFKSCLFLPWKYYLENQTFYLPLRAPKLLISHGNIIKVVAF